jgi:hypothetical protein
MPITINGSGTVTGITAGGLPDGVITTDDIAAGAVTDAKVNASAAIADSKLSGATCKAWVNFNGTGVVAIRASYNVSSITDNGVGDYTVNFTNALADANYAVAVCTTATGGGGPVITINASAAVPTSSAIRFLMGDTSAVKDVAYNNVAIFR